MIYIYYDYIVGVLRIFIKEGMLGIVLGVEDISFCCYGVYIF